MVESLEEFRRQLEVRVVSVESRGEAAILRVNKRLREIEARLKKLEKTK